MAMIRRSRRSRGYHFAENGWVLWDDEWINRVLSDMSSASDGSSAVAKLLLRFFGYKK
jgi:hypothetical protein